MNSGRGIAAPPEPKWKPSMARDRAAADAALLLRDWIRMVAIYSAVISAVTDGPCAPPSLLAYVRFAAFLARPTVDVLALLAITLSQMMRS